MYLTQIKILSQQQFMTFSLSIFTANNEIFMLFFISIKVTFALQKRDRVLVSFQKKDKTVDVRNPQVQKPDLSKILMDGSLVSDTKSPNLGMNHLT